MKKLLAIAGIGFAICGTAVAGTITFDDLPGPDGKIPDGYGGLHWSYYFFYVDGLVQGAGYQAGIVSPNNVAMNDAVNPVDFSGDQLFTLNSAYFTAAWFDDNVLTIQGYDGATLKYSTDVAINTHGPTFVTFDWVGVDQVSMSSSHYQFAMDNLTINGVPESGITIAFLAAALGALGLIRRLLRWTLSVEPRPEVIKITY